MQNEKHVPKLTRLDRGQHRRDAGELGIEVARIRRVLDLGQEGWLDALVVDVLPVDVPEEGLGHNLLRIGRATTQALIGLPSEELL